MGQRVRFWVINETGFCIEEEKKFELYDIENNPDETINLAELPEYQKLLASLIVKLKKFQQETYDPWIIIWENNAILQRNTERL